MKESDRCDTEINRGPARKPRAGFGSGRSKVRQSDDDMTFRLLQLHLKRPGDTVVPTARKVVNPSELPRRHNVIVKFGVGSYTDNRVRPLIVDSGQVRPSRTATGRQIRSPAQKPGAGSACRRAVSRSEHSGRTHVVERYLHFFCFSTCERNGEEKPVMGSPCASMHGICQTRMD
ncbi:hypothetical protein EVAR_25171_1 [Eumeta japonica]|uniref:Uncharacterized protein n=1 Tax=Eumeta variegata TaxID=151549 RepID=A0A4C1VRL8_EUMVA|nr:hypothetical protein EVAR_25171_1 [Eumeta japonica]